ncbi:MAG: TonB-dependent receptor plug domain-containing protein [Flavobacterium sp.]|nr:TonB-dependent receptor plug domain-containing protein [Flavobacterium sp.]
MNKLYFAILFFVSATLSAQDYGKSWNKVIIYENDGKIKSADEEVAKIFKSAKNKHIDVQVIKCFFYKSKYMQTLEENAQFKIISLLQKEIREASIPSKSILNLIYAKTLNDYYSKNAYQLSQRTKIDSAASGDFLTWNAADFTNAIRDAFDKTIANKAVLKKVPLTDYEAIFDFLSLDKFKTETLYTYMLKEQIEYFSSNASVNDVETFTAIRNNMFDDTAVFKNVNLGAIKSENAKKILEFYQELEVLDPNLENQFNRIVFCKTYIPIYTEEAFFNALLRMQKKNPDEHLNQRLLLEKAVVYQKLASKELHPDYNAKAVAICDSILSIKNRSNAFHTAMLTKSNIQSKMLSAKLQQFIYPNQQTRALINYKNIDSFSVSFYKISQKQFQDLTDWNKKYDRDSIVASIRTKKPVKAMNKILTEEKDYFPHDTEVLLPNLEKGIYLTYFESNNTNDSKKVASYDYITVTNFAVATSVLDKIIDFQVLHRKTGQPIANAILKNDRFNLKTNVAGKATYKSETEKYYNEAYQIFKDGDTLAVKNSYSGYFNTYRSDTEEDSNSEVRLYLDRAIYRPGQTVYYKGIAISQLNQRSEVVPKTRFTIIIDDANYKEFKKFDVTTNDFGSFSGTFVLPTNVMTGQFSIEVEEPEDIEKDSSYNAAKDEHPFWDNTNFNNDRVTFNVEEYKRPKFEVQFDPIKESIAVNQKVTVTGKAKSFDGSNVSGADVKYTIRFHSKDANLIEAITTTDANGNFSIIFTTLPNEDSNEKDLPVFYYSINADVTDVNGETHTARTSVKAGYHTLDISASLSDRILTNEKNKIRLTTNNLNGEFMAAKGKVEIFFESPFPYKFRNRLWKRPEISGISDTEFERLFPYEENSAKPYQQRTLAAEQLLYSKAVDTQNSLEIPMDFIADYRSGYYRIVFSSTDNLGHLIKYTRYFVLQQNKDKFDTSVLFKAEQINENPAKDGFVAIKVTSVIPELYLQVTGNYEYGRFFLKDANLQNHEAIIRIPLQKDFQKNVKITVEGYFENQSFDAYVDVALPEIKPELHFETATFRDRIQPGSAENWSFKIKAKDTTAESEILASMYDASLDQFSESYWQDLRFNDRGNSYSSRGFYGYQVADITLRNLNAPQPYILSKNEKTQLIWFDFNINKSIYLNYAYREIINKKAPKPANAALIYGIIVAASDGLALPGVSVLVNGTVRGSVSDFDGYFQIEAAIGEKLTFSFVGMKNKTVTITNKELNITLEDDEMALENVVVAGYDVKTTKAKSNMASVTVSAATIEARPNASFLQTLQGQVAGLEINYGNGQPGSGTTVILRGLGSINGKTSPLYVIDGVPLSDDAFRSLNPDDIISVSVLKDAGATAIYGNRGANGVIIVNTKSAIDALVKVKPRQNLSEFAFFFPELRTDKDGNFSFNFTSPEALTEWRFRMLAHNKKAVSALYEESVVTQKDVMITPNFPRFLREKDTVVISCKIANITNEPKTGIAILQLFDAATMQEIDTKTMNVDNMRNFNVAAINSTVTSWKIIIPEGLQGIQYRILAKSGDFSDGEENIIPVLTNNLLVTETLPLWVRENSKKEYTFENLKNNTSTTLRNHQLILEYTSNPAWIAIQSLPYLMEYEHECAEQTFSRYYANAIASEIIKSNPKIAEVFSNWEKSSKLISQLEQNAELKSILLAETPWLADAKSETEQKKNLALLFDLEKMKNSSENTFQKIIRKQMPSGAFSWFEGGSESEYITRHILAGFGHLQKMNIHSENQTEIDNLIKNGLVYLDAQFVRHEEFTYKLKKKPQYFFNTSDMHYLYMRSFFTEKFPLPEKIKKLANANLKLLETRWLDFSLYEKGMAALVFSRFGYKETAKKILVNLKETASNNEGFGMYWIENKSGWYWYQAPIETQAMLIEAFAEVTNDTKSVDAMKVWLLKNKQNKNWPTTKATTEAVYALLMQGSDWLSVKDNTVFRIGDEKIVSKKLSENEKEAETGYIKLTWKGNEIDSKMATLTIDNKSKVPGYGGFYWQYFEDLDKIKNDSKGALSVAKELYLKKNGPQGEILQKITSGNTIKIGDLVTVRLVITATEVMEYVHLKDMRASCFEPVDVISGYQWRDNIGFYKSTKDAATHFFFDNISKGKYVLEYDLRVNNEGDFSNGITTIESMYAPEFSSHTKGIRVNVKK